MLFIKYGSLKVGYVTITIASEKVLSKNCDPSDYVHLWDSPDLHIASEFHMNITLLRCDTLDNESIFRQKLKYLLGWGSTFEGIPPNFLQQCFQIEWHENESFSQSCISCEDSDGICGYRVSDLEFVCFCQDRIHVKDCHDVTHILEEYAGGERLLATRYAIIIGTGIGGAFLIIVAAILLVIYKKKKKMLPQIQLCLGKDPVNPKCKISKAKKFLEDFAYKMPIRYSYPELKKMTNNFSDKLGKEGSVWCTKESFPTAPWWLLNYSTSPDIAKCNS
eukprot:Gb_36418 [translate_table: standard]